MYLPVLTQRYSSSKIKTKFFRNLFYKTIFILQEIIIILGPNDYKLKIGKHNFYFI